MTLPCALTTLSTRLSSTRINSLRFLRKMDASNLVNYDLTDSESSSLDGSSDDERDYLGLQSSSAHQTPPPPSSTFSFDSPTLGIALLPSSKPLQEDHASSSNLPRPSLEPLPSTSGSVKKYALNFEELPQPMKVFFTALRSYFTKPVNLQRQKPAVALSTINKAQERLLCFLGFAHATLGLDLKPELFLRMALIEDYLTFLKVERRLTSNTMANHAASLIYPAKFLHREHSPDYRDIEVVRRLRGQVATLQREGRVERPCTREDLVEQNKWLDWEEIVGTVALQRERMEMARTGTARARECADLVLLSLYVLIPPSRANEVRTLEILSQAVPMTSPQVAGKNLVSLQQDGGITFRFQNYKTVKFYGSDSLILKNDHELSHILRDYVDHHRHRLVTDESAQFLLLRVGSDYLYQPIRKRVFGKHL